MVKKAATIRRAHAVWMGGLKDGNGKLSSDSGALSEAPYGYGSRFESGAGTNPEELIAAAHAGCFSMALASMLSQAGLKPARIETRAAITLEKLGDGYAITASHLDVAAKVPGASYEQFDEIANKAKAGCPVSKVLNANITMLAKLEQ